MRGFDEGVALDLCELAGRFLEACTNPIAIATLCVGESAAEGRAVRVKVVLGRSACAMEGCWREVAVGCGRSACE